MVTTVMSLKESILEMKKRGIKNQNEMNKYLLLILNYLYYSVKVCRLSILDPDFSLNSLHVIAHLEELENLLDDTFTFPAGSLSE